MVQGDFICKNDFVRQNCEKMYLNSSTADVFFEFNIDSDDDEYEQVPAHKILLSIGSPVFETMFYGLLKEKREIPIVDASADAFKIFLQFFYLSEISLNGENLAEITNLCKKYELDDCLKSCETALKDTLSIEEMCWGIRFAIFMELEDLTKFCEEKIKENAAEILQTESFLECDQKTFYYILLLVCYNCNASKIVDASMEWAKAECKRQDLDETSQNLKDRIGEAFELIPFHGLSFNELSIHTVMYKGFFTIEELETIIQKISFLKESEPQFPTLTKELPRRKSNWKGYRYCFNRITENNYLHELKRSNRFTDTFYTKQHLRLMEIYFEKAIDCDASLDFIVKRFDNDKWLASGFFDKTTGRAKLPKPIEIIADTKYVIVLQGKFGEEFSIYTPVLRDEYHLTNACEVFFEQTDYAAVTKIAFETFSLIYRSDEDCTD